MFHRSLRAAALGLVLTALVAGCSVTREDQKRQDELDVMTDIFGNEKSEPNENGLFAGVFGNSAADKKRQQENEQRLAELERQLQQQALASERAGSATQPDALADYSGTRIKLGGVLAGSDDAALALRFQQALDASAKRYPVTAASRQQLNDQLAQPACAQPAEPACAAALAVYPGLRMLAVVDARVDKDSLTGTITLVDAAHALTYPTTAFRVPALDSKVTDAALQGLADQIAYSAVDRAALAPWSTRAFASSGKEWHLSAGQRSGLKVGDRLEIRGPGKLIRSPTGSPAGWVPGPRKGVLEVRGFFGEDFATAALIEGTAPGKDDLLVKP